MRKYYFVIIFVTLIFYSLTSQVSYTWNGASSNNWSTFTNWTPNGIPGAIDNVNIVVAPNACVLSGNTTINNLTITSGSINIGGFALNIVGVGNCIAGTVSSGTLNFTGTTLTFAGTLFNTAITANVGDVYFNGSTFNQALTVTKNSASNIQSTGNNIYNGTTSITNAGTGYLLLTNNAAKTELFNGALTLNTSNSGNIYIGYNGNATLTANTLVNNSSSNGSIYLGFNGALNLNPGVTITTGVFSAGTLYLYKFNQVAGTPQTLSPGTTGGVSINSSTLNSGLTVSAGNIYSNGTTYNSTVVFNKTGGTNNALTGGNTFNNTFTANHSGIGYWGFGNGIADVFNGDVYLNNTSANERILIGQNSTNNQFNGNVYVTQNGAANGIALGWGGAAPICVMAPTKSIFIGTGGFSVGYLQLLKLAQSDATPINLITTGTSNVQLNNSVFSGSLSITSPDIYPYGGIYNKAVVFTKTGIAGNHNNGNLNIFNSTLTINNQGNGGFFLLGYNSADQFNDDVIVTSTANGGISLGWSGGTGTPTLAAGKSIQIGSAGFSSGYLQFGSLTQLGSAPINLNMTGTSSFYIVKCVGNCVFGGAMAVTCPDIYVRGGTFNGTAAFTKTAGTSNHNNGVQNIFNSTCTINQQSNAGYFMLGYNSNDLFNDDITVTSSGSGGIYLGWQSGFGTPTLASGKTIIVGSGGFSSGFLQLNKFTQLGSSPINLNFTGSSTYLLFANSTAIGGDLNINSPSIYFNGATFNGSVTCVKTGNNSDASQGGNLFQSVCTFTNSGGGYLLFANNNPDIWNNDVSFTNSGTERILPAWNSTGNQFNGNITLNSIGGSIGVNFCGGGTSSATLATGKGLQIGSSGFSSGYLILPRFTQLGNSPVTLNLTATSNYLTIGPNSTIGGVLTVTAPSINNFIQSTFNGVVNVTKTGAANDSWQSGNTYNAAANYTNTGSGYMGMGWTYPDTWNDDVSFTNFGTERILPCWVAPGNLFNGNITVNSFGSSIGIHFCGSASSSATLSAAKSLQIGSSGYSSGYLILPRFTQLGNSPVTLNLAPTSNYLTIGPNSTIGGVLTVTAPSINNFVQSTFNGVVNVTKTGPVNDSWQSGNTYNSAANYTNTGSGYMGMGWTYPDIWNSDVSFTNFGTDRILPCWQSVGNLFNGNVTVNSFGSSVGIHFCGGPGSATMAATKSIFVGSSGFSSGYLILKAFTQLGNASINLTLSPTASYLQYGPASAFGGNVTSTSPGLYFNGCTFSGVTTFTKTGTTNDASVGNNVFNNTTTMNNLGSGYLLFGNGNADQFNSASTFNNFGSSHIYVAYNSTNNIFGGPVTFNNSPTSTNSWIYVAPYSANNSTFNSSITVSCVNGAGVSFGSSTGTSTLSAGNTISVSSSGFNNGALVLKNFTQLGSTSQSLSTTVASNIQYGPSSSFGGNVTSSSPGLYFNGCTFSGTTTCTKTGATNDNSSGNNIFNNITTLNNTGSGYLLLGNSNSDQFNSASTFNNLGSSHIYVAYNSSNNVFGGPVTFNNSPTSSNSWIYVAPYSTNNSTFNSSITVSCVNGAGVYFGLGTGTSTLSAGNTISVSGSGFNNGALVLKNFTQLGPTSQSLSTTVASNIQYGPSSSFGGNVTSTSPGLYFNGCTFSGITTCTKTGATNDNSSGNNIFNATTTLNNTGSGYLQLGNGNSDQFNSTSTFNNLGSSHIYVAYNSSNNVFGGPVTFNNTPISTGSYIFVASYLANNSTFNDNITVNCINGAGVNFGSNTGKSILAAGKTILVGTSFNSGILNLANFTQLSATPQNLITTGTSLIQYGPLSIFNGDLTSSSPGVLFTTTTFNGNVSTTKTGNTNDASTGGNTFNGTTTLLTDNGSGYLLMANGLSDSYNTNVSFIQNGGGIVYPNYNTNCTYAGDVSITSPSTSTITFGANTSGIATFVNGNSQVISKTGATPNPVFTRLVMSKSSNSLTLNTRINISSSLTLTSGIINTSSTNILNINNAALTTVGNSLSYVNGPMNYDMAFTGTRTLNFPIGKAADWRPAILNVAHSNGTSYTYNSEVFNASAQALGWSVPATISWVSSTHYWDINRVLTSSGANTPTAGLSGTQTITLFYGGNDGVTQPTYLSIAKNTYTSTSSWRDIGGAGATITTGSVSSTSAPSVFNSFSRFTLANKIDGNNPLPIELLTFDAKPIDKNVAINWSTASELNNHHFEIERSGNGINFDYLFSVPAHGNGNSNITQNYSAEDKLPLSGISYYRLRQVDKTNISKTSLIVSVNFLNSASITIFPNPSSGKLTIMGIENTTTFKLIDAWGRELLSAVLDQNQNQINISHFSAGVYYVLIDNGFEIKRIKIILEK